MTFSKEIFALRGCSLGLEQCRMVGYYIAQGNYLLRRRIRYIYFNNIEFTVFCR